MLRKIIVALTAFSIAIPPAFADQYIFRYKYGFQVSAVEPEVPGEEDYDIRANFVGYPGEDFSQSIPVKGAQPIAYWRITNGSLPQGVGFDQASGLLSGTPARVQAVSFDAVGYTAAGAEGTKAKVTFSVVAPDEKMVRVDGYGHVDRNMAVNISPSGIVVDRWTANEALPVWLKASGSLLQGTPPLGSEGVYAVNLTGYDFSGTEVATARGNILIENGPTIAFIPDQVLNLNTYTTIAAKVNRAIGELTWSLEGDALPQSLAFDNKGAIRGSLRNFNTSAKMRFVARDVDGTTGYSNYFAIASREPDTDIGNIDDQSLVLGTPFQLVVTASDLQGEKNWSIQSGELPEGMELNAKTGVISGVPAKLETKENIVLAVTSSNGGSSTSNAFSMTVFPAPITIAGEQTHVRVGKNFSSPPLVVTGAMQPYSIRLANGETMPAGLTLNPANGVVSGVLPSAVSHSLPLVVVDAEGRVSKSYSLGITSYNNLAISVSPQTTNVPRLKEIVSPTVAVAEQSIIPSKANPFGEYELAGTLPVGLTFAKTSGRIYGTPSVEGSYGPFTISVIDGNGERATSNAFQIEVGPREALTATAPDLTIYALQSLFNSRPVKVDNSVGKVTYELVGTGVLPEGVKLTQDGYLQGAASKVGVFEGITIKATDAEGQTATTEPFKITVAPAKAIELVDNAFEWTTGKAFSFDLKAVNADNPVTYVFADRNTLPAAVQMSSSGQLTGTVATPGTYRGTVTITDKQSRTSTVQITLTIKDAMAMQLASEHNLSRGSQANVTPAVENAIGTLKFTQTGALPDGLSFDPSNGSISGIPTKEGEWANIQIVARDDASNTASVTTKLIVGQRKTLAIAYDFSNGLIEGSTTGLPKFPIEPTNAIGDVSYSVAGTLPAGLTFNASSGAFAGVPTVAGVFDNIVVTATDSEGATAKTGAMSIRVEKGGQFKIKDLMVTARVGDFINTGAPDIENGVAPMSFTAGAGKPSGINVNLVNGSVSGTLTAAGTHSFIVTATDGVAKTATYKVTIVVVGDLKLSYPATTNANQFTEALIEPSVDNLVGKASYELASGTLPSGMRVDAATGRIVGAPDQTGTFGNIVVRLTDGGQTSYAASSNPFSIVVGTRLALEVDNADENLALVNHTYQLKAKALNAVGNVTWTISGSLPDGLSANNSTGTISGTPTTIGEWPSITLSAVDDKGATATKTIKITTAADGNPLLLTTYSVKGKPGVPFTSSEPSVLNAIGEVRFSSPDLTSYGLTIDPVTGVISGTVNSVIKITANIRVTDSTNRLTSEFILIEIVPSIRIVMRAAIDATVGADINPVKPTVDYAVGAVNFTLLGNLPAGLVFNNKTGTISGKPTVIGVSDPLIIRVVDATDDSANTEPFVITVHDDGVLPRVQYSTSGTGYTENNTFGTITPTRYNTQKSGDKYSINKSLPNGLAFDEDTGEISGRLSIGSAGIYEGYIVTVVNLAEQKGESNEFLIKVLPSSRTGVYKAKTIPARHNQLVDFGKPEYDQSRMVGDITYSVTGKNPSTTTYMDVGVDPKTGAAWATIKNGVSTAYFDLTATDALGSTSARYTINPLLLKATYDDKYYLEVGEYALTAEPTLTNAEGDLTFEISTGTLPQGLQLDTLSGQFYGTPTQSGTSRISVKATDKYGSATSNAFDLVVQSTAVAAFDIPDLVDQNNTGARVYSARIPIVGNTANVPFTFEGPSDVTTRVCYPSNPGGICYNINSTTTQPKQVGEGGIIEVSMIPSTTLGETKTVRVFVGNQSAVWNVTTRKAKTEPDDFNFLNIVDSAPDVSVASATITLAGMPDPLPFTLTYYGTNPRANSLASHGLYVNGVAKRLVNNTVSGTLSNGNKIYINGLSETGFLQESYYVLQIGTMVKEFRVTTRELDDTPDDFEFPTLSDVAPSAIINSNQITVTGISDPVPFEVTYYGTNPYANTNTQHSVVYGSGSSYFKTNTITGTISNNQKFSIKALSENGGGLESFYTVKIGSVTKEFRLKTRVYVDTPEDFNFPDAVNQPPYETATAAILSAEVTVQGVPDPVPVTLTAVGNGSTSYFQKNGSIYQMGSVQMNGMTVKTGDKILIRGTAPRGNETEAIYTLRVGTLTRTFKIVTRPLVTTPEPFTFTEQSGLAGNKQFYSDTITVAGIPDSIPFTFTYIGPDATKPKYIIVNGTLTSFPGTTLTYNYKTGMTLRLYATSSVTPGEKVIIRVRAGDYTTDWTLTTAP
ncbi:putative Ig domain-containing protein [Mesorhizobium sp. SP-1A]|uniref:putative Ig domain-containing protein n=1 Tax=Mesorhizobium sp. SP-1A TaxID=3077840 RepID=UPI0028F6C9B7|nr:putative Ig domain-containing protein [Mesorhizobium sp. SP-1A]